MTETQARVTGSDPLLPQSPFGVSGVLHTAFDWSYDSGRDQILSLYEKGKDRQWNARSRLDWSHEVDPDNPLGMPDEFIWIADSPLWERLPERERALCRLHTAGWLYSQFLHGEQGALVCAAKIVQVVPDLDAKFYASTQVIDEARHVEAYSRYLREKIGVSYPVTSALKGVLADVISDQRWDVTCLGMQVLIEGLAIAAFSIQRDHMRDPLAKTFNALILADEARHVAFGRLALRDYYRQLSSAELREREEFAAETCWALRDRFFGEDMWRTLDVADPDECVAYARKSPAMREFRRRLFQRIVPTLKDINLLGPHLQRDLARMGVLRFSALSNDDLLADDDRRAREVERQELNARAEAVQDVVALGAGEPQDRPDGRAGDR
jgi:hypothetical protein